MSSDLLAKRFAIISSFLDERSRRLFLASEAMAIGHGGISFVAKQTGVSRATIASGCLELAGLKTIDNDRTRRRGGGRKKLSEKDPSLRQTLRSLLEYSEGDDKGCDLLWTTLSLRTLCSELSQRNQPVSRNLLARLLREMGWSYHRQRRLGGESLAFEDRDTQFKKIAYTVQTFQNCGNPVIYLEMEILAQGENEDSEVLSENALESVVFDRPKTSTPDTKGQRATEACQSGIQNRTLWGDAAMDRQLVLSGVELVCQWWRVHGHTVFPGAGQLLIVTNGVDAWDSRVGILSKMLEEVGKGFEFILTVCLLPSGMSKWRNVTCRVSTSTTWNVPGRPPFVHKVTLSQIGGLPVASGSYVDKRACEDCHQDKGLIER